MVSSIALRSDRLTVDIAPPGTVYRGSRFDWTGFITQVTLDKRHTFCAPESLQEGQGSGGIGLCNEFGIDQPIGYADAKPGDLFPKLGIGLLRRPDGADYSFGRSYEIAQAFPVRVDVESSGDRATFVTEPVDCRGYAARLTKTVGVRSNVLEIAYQLDNAGSQPLATIEYCHNFVAIDGHLIGPDYRLRLPYPIQLERLTPLARQTLPRVARTLLPDALLDRLADNALKRMTSALDISGSDVRFRAAPQQAYYFRPLGYARTEQPQWELALLPQGVAMREHDDFAPCRVAVWGTGHVISAEVFASIQVPPGGTQRWTRRYEFLSELAGGA